MEREPEAFGISLLILNKSVKKRAFMGWSTTTENSILSTPYERFSLNFWNAWLGANNSPDVQVIDAINTALALSPGVNAAEFVWFGSSTLKWSD
ncbi:MAG: hypothetical protein ACYDH9_12190 [Limisphaerales bacterium]